MIRCKWFVLLTVWLAAFCTVCAQPAQPKQPLHGPGSSETRSHSVISLKIADGGKGGWLFLPSDPVPEKAPVVIFCHGWGAINSRGYQAWIDHLVMRGNIVLWPNYQDNLRTPTAQFLPNAIAAVKAGLELLRTEHAGVLPDTDRMAVTGHSAGGMVAAGIAAKATSEGLPQISAVMPVEPGDSRRGGIASVPLADLSSLPHDTLLLVLVGEDDTSVGTFDGQRILHESVHVPESNKALFMLHSDDHGSPALVANHFAPSATLPGDSQSAEQPFRFAISRNSMNAGTVDALDYMGIWRLLDQLLDAAFMHPQNSGFFLDPGVLSMGYWSDGIPIKPLTRLQ